MLVRIIKAGVAHRGKDVALGTCIVLPERSAKSLVDAGVAEKCRTEPVPGQEEKVIPAAEQWQGEVNPTKEEEKTAREAVEATVRVTKALDDQYKRDELAAAAKAASVEFPYDAKKAEIITAVIEQGKEATLLK